MDFVAVDIETTGFSQRYDSIIQIGAVKIVDDKKVAEFNRYIHTTKQISETLTEITGITNKLLNEKGEPYSVVLTDFIEFIGDFGLVAHNVQFDMRFLKQKIASKFGKELKNPQYCTMKLARSTFPNLEKHKLDYVAGHLGIPNPSHHNAINDARVCADILLKISGKEAVATEPETMIDAVLNSVSVSTRFYRHNK